MAIDPQACTDHHAFWRLKEPRRVDHTVRLRDQFHKEEVRRRLIAVTHLGNPARKTRKGHEEEDIHQAKVHLLAYQLDQYVRPHDDQKVRIRNQFTGSDGHVWVVGEAPLLLIPARKSHDEVPTTPPPPRVDHFLCYKVLEFDGPGIEESIGITDQFGAATIEYLRPLFLGVPADKNGEGLLHPEVHLAIYEMTPPVRPPSTISVNTADQLEAHEGLLAEERVWLGVPSLKEWPL
jgi:hypothetical protein